jgi:hypothetical protein
MLSKKTLPVSLEKFSSILVNKLCSSVNYFEIEVLCRLFVLTVVSTGREQSISIKSYMANVLCKVLSSILVVLCDNVW